jgi:DNA adenine methylase
MMSKQESQPNPRQVVVPGTTPLLPPRAGCTPPLKWVGSKRWLVPLLAPAVYERLAVTRGRYIEPFLGGGAIALDLGLPGMLLADNCKPLIVTYQAMRKSPAAVAWALKALVDKGTDKESYLRVRANETNSPVLTAARFLYLNRFGFNGLYRENSKGKFNVPHGGDRSSASIPDGEALEVVAQALKGADLRVADFRDTIATAQKGDVVYADSPYYETFNGYTAGGFTEDDHTALANALRAAHGRGAAVIASNSDHERVRELYDWAFVTPVHERHAVGATAERRGLRPAVLIVSDETILRGEP